MYYIDSSYMNLVASFSITVDMVEEYVYDDDEDISKSLTVLYRSRTQMAMKMMDGSKDHDSTCQ